MLETSKLWLCRKVKGHKFAMIKQPNFDACELLSKNCTSLWFLKINSRLQLNIDSKMSFAWEYYAVICIYYSRLEYSSLTLHKNYSHSFRAILFERRQNQWRKRIQNSKQQNMLIVAAVPILMTREAPLWHYSTCTHYGGQRTTLQNRSNRAQNGYIRICTIFKKERCRPLLSATPNVLLAGIFM